MEKKTIAVLFGGQSTEHEVSCVSAAHVISLIDPERYEVLLIGITKDGRWLKAERAEQLTDGTWTESPVQAVLSPDTATHGILIRDGDRVRTQRVDLLFPVLHGLHGEDGTMQGLFELSGIPYVGCGVLASSVSMDKLYTKIIVDTLGIAQARCVRISRREFSRMERVTARVEEAFPYPVFVKPANTGSSVGISRAKNRDELIAALHLAAEIDSVILAEEAIAGRELECSVLEEEGQIRVSGIGEILAGAEFYDYEAKYHSSASRTVLDPDLPEGRSEEIRQDAKDIFRAVGGRGLSRVDFFLEEGTNRVVFNEINTLPGFTSISMYEKLWERKGLSGEELVEKLIRSGFCRQEDLL